MEQIRHDFGEQTKEMGMDVSFIAKALKVTSDVVNKWLGIGQVQ